MKIAAQLLAPYGRYLASVKPSQVDLATSNRGEGHKASRSKDQRIVVQIYVYYAGYWTHL